MSCRAWLLADAVDDPFVESGNRWMGFYWKDGKDQLLARSGDLPPAENAAPVEPSMTGHPWTTFTMALRDPAPLEGPLDFARFLVTSLTFMRTIKKIDMLVDDTKVLEVRKDVTGQHKVSRTGLNTTSSLGMMRVQGVESTSMVITARVMQWLSREFKGNSDRCQLTIRDGGYAPTSAACHHGALESDGRLPRELLRQREGAHPGTDP